jgi:hypothetical protein
VTSMQRAVVQAGAWTLATGAAVTLSWIGVHAVLAETAYEPPRALPVTDHPSSTAQPQASSTHRPKPSPTTSSRPPTSRSAKPPHPSDTPNGPGGTAGSGGHGSTSPGNHGRPDGGAPDGRVQGVTVPGGRAVFDMGARSASLVSATPEGGWSMQVWKAPTWIRVLFYRDDEASSVFCRWDDGPPRIEKVPD